MYGYCTLLENFQPTMCRVSVVGDVFWVLRILGTICALYLYEWVMCSDSVDYASCMYGSDS